MASNGQVQINWRTAEIHEGSLTVELTGEAPKGWGKHFKGVLALLEQNSSQWEKISLRKDRITVTDVRAGSEEELRHLLESVLLQVNSDLEGDHPEPSSEPGDDHQAEADQRMTDSFRAFAQPGQ
jgi:hypothetical protein